MTTSVAPSPSSSAEVDSEPFVLLVDDHGPSLALLRALVESAGLACLSARSGAEALACCDVRRPAVVVTDLIMPTLDGRCLARWLEARFPKLPILLMTGEHLDSEAIEGFQRTFCAVLTKPLELDHFLTLLRELMPSNGRSA